MARAIFIHTHTVDERTTETLTALKLSGAAPTTVDLDVSFALRSLCGTYNDDLIHGVMNDVIQVGLVRVDHASGAVRWQVWLPAEGSSKRPAPPTVDSQASRR